MSGYLWPYQVAFNLSNNFILRKALTSNHRENQLYTNYLHKLKNVYSLDKINILDLKGNVVASSDFHSIGQNFFQRIFIQTSLQGEGVQTAILSPVDGRNYVVTTSPIFSSRKEKRNFVIGVVVIFKRLCR